MRIVTIFILLVATLICNGASAQSLEERLRELERRVEQLERKEAERQQTPSGAPRKTSRTAAEPWRQIANWRSLKLGMTDNDVRSILGDPDKVEVGSLVTLWYYEYPKGGRVRFSSSDHRVEGWTEPEK